MIRFRSSVALACVGLLLVNGTIHAAEDSEEPSVATRHVLPTLNGNVIAERVMSGLSQPTAIEFLPGGQALVVQRDVGVLSLVNFTTGERTDIEGMPSMTVFSDAGAHDVELHPQYSDNGWIYVSYSEGQEVHSTLVLDRIRLDGARVTKRERVFSANAFSESAYHYGARIQFVDGYLFLTVGDRQHPDRAQDVDNHAGAILRLHDDGRVPEDNPFTDQDTERGGSHLPEIWSYGHRNPQGLYVHPGTGELWSNEHGPRGGDELNLIKKGANYGWPVVSYGFEYDGGPIGTGIPGKEGMEAPVWTYVPSIAPSDMVIYQGEAFPAWEGDFFIGALALQHLNRLVLRDGQVIAEERIAAGKLGRIRAIAVDAGGLFYLGNDNGEIWRLSPE